MVSMLMMRMEDFAYIGFQTIGVILSKTPFAWKGRDFGRSGGECLSLSLEYQCFCHLLPYNVVMFK